MVNTRARKANTFRKGAPPLGRILVIANRQGRGIYLLAHLSGFAPGITRHSHIEPGETVAFVGRSGANRREAVWNAHLHVEYYAVQYVASLDTDDDNPYVQLNETSGWLELRPALTGQGRNANNILNRRNPFNHDEVWIQA
jgi:hypothetical protein